MNYKMRVRKTIQQDEFLINSASQNAKDDIADITNDANWTLYTKDDKDPDFKEMYETWKDENLTLIVYALYKENEFENQMGVYFFSNGTYETHWGDGGGKY